MTELDDMGGGGESQWRNRTMTVLQKAVVRDDGEDESPIEGEGSEWNVLVVPPDLIYSIERTFAAWMNIVVWSYTFGTLMMTANPALAIGGLDVRLADGAFNMGLVFSLFALLMFAWHCYVYERRMRMFKGSRKYFNRFGIYLILIPMGACMFMGLVADIVYGANEVLQTAQASTNTTI